MYNSCNQQNIGCEFADNNGYCTVLGCRKYNKKLSNNTIQGLETIDKLADLICFHAKCRENGEELMKPFNLERKKNIE